MAAATIFGVAGGVWGVYAIHDQQPGVPADIATTTTNIADIFARYYKFDRAIDQQTFLKDYLNVPVFGFGTFDNLGGSSDSTLYLDLTLNLGVGNVVMTCRFQNPDDLIKRRLNVLAKGNKITFTGIFSGSAIFGSNRWLIESCNLLP